MVDLSVSEISAKLADQAASVVSHLLPSAKPYGTMMVCGDVLGSPGDSLKINISGSFVGEWRDWATDDHGDLIDLWRFTRNLTPAEAITQAKAFLGIAEPLRTQERKAYSKPKQIDSTPPKPQGKAMFYLLSERKLSEKTISDFKIETSPEMRAIIFPSYNPSGELVNRSYRTLDAKKKVWQDKDCAPSLFGWQALPESAYKKRAVLLSEGQIDACTWHQWGVAALSTGRDALGWSMNGKI